MLQSPHCSMPPGDTVLPPLPRMQMLRFPHYTAVRPLTVLYCGPEGGACFREKLFVRGLVATLMGNARFRSSSGSGCSLGGSGGRGSVAPELIWWDVLQPRLGMQDRELSRWGGTREGGGVKTWGSQRLFDA